jgi:hypothetical protein
MVTTNEDLHTIVHGMQKDIDHIQSVISKLDLTIDKLNIVSSNINNILTIQTERLEFQMKHSSQTADLIESRRRDSEATTKEIYSHLDSLDKNLRTDMDKKFDEIIDAISNLKKSIDDKTEKLELKTNDEYEKTDIRIKALEMWRWIIVGGGAIIFFLLDKAPNIFHIFT